jgi:hypothetical protein
MAHPVAALGDLEPKEGERVVAAPQEAILEAVELGLQAGREVLKRDAVGTPAAAVLAHAGEGVVEGSAGGDGVEHGCRRPPGYGPAWIEDTPRRGMLRFEVVEESRPRFGSRTKRPGASRLAEPRSQSHHTDQGNSEKKRLEEERLADPIIYHVAIPPYRSGQFRAAISGDPAKDLEFYRRNPTIQIRAIPRRS